MIQNLEGKMELQINSLETKIEKMQEMFNKDLYKQGEKTALKLGENNSKRSNRQRINLKNIQATPPAQLQKNKMTQSKNGPKN